MPEGFSVAEWQDISGTALLDEVNTTYDDLVRTFGEPQFSDLKGLEGDKNTTEWYLNTPSGVAHIYDYDDVEGRPLGQFDWHIGGLDIDVVEDIKNEISLRATYGPARIPITYDFGKGFERAHPHDNGGGWVADTATVEPSVFVGPDAKVCDFAQVSGGARLSGHTIISDRAIVMDNALILDSVVADDALVTGEARVINGCVIRDHANVGGFATVAGGVDVYGSAAILGYASVFDNATVGDEARVDGYATVHGRHAHLYGPAKVDGFASLDNVG
jgi:carbonic anhydrase/acetyltransferase-like protein (isoleucine patch superfamily)